MLCIRAATCMTCCGHQAISPLKATTKCGAALARAQVGMRVARGRVADAACNINLGAGLVAGLVLLQGWVQGW